MHTAAAAAQLHWVLQVEHFVEDDVLEHVSGHPRMVEDPADDDGVVGGIVVAEAVAGVVAAPGKLGASQEFVEEAAVQVFKDFL